jgi:hypothetical protein
VAAEVTISNPQLVLVRIQVARTAAEILTDAESVVAVKSAVTQAVSLPQMAAGESIRQNFNKGEHRLLFALDYRDGAFCARITAEHEIDGPFVTEVEERWLFSRPANKADVTPDRN